MSFVPIGRAKRSRVPSRPTLWPDYICLRAITSFRQNKSAMVQRLKAKK